LTAEDLANVGPGALLQALAVVATLGIRHAERNGHHYFAGLRQFPPSMQEAILTWHGDLYARHAAGFPVLKIEDGAINLRTLIEAPFGLGFVPDFSDCIPLAEWSPDSLASYTE